MKIGGGDVAPVSHASSFSALISDPSVIKPITDSLSEDASNLAELHPDWQDLVRRRALRSIISIPIRKQSVLLGCLTLGSLDPVDWDEQWWYGGLQLISSWAMTALSQNESISCLSFFEQVNVADSLGALATAFVHSLPDSLNGMDLGGKVETRLALVSSHLTRALVYANEPGSVYDSREDLQRLMMTDPSGTRLAKMTRTQTSVGPLFQRSSLPSLSPSLSYGESFLNSIENMEQKSSSESSEEEGYKEDFLSEGNVKEDSVMEAVLRLRQSLSTSPGESKSRDLSAVSEAYGTRPSGSNSSPQVNVIEKGTSSGASRGQHRSANSGPQRRVSAHISSTIRRIQRRSSTVITVGAAAAGLLQIGDSNEDLEQQIAAGYGISRQHSNVNTRSSICVTIPTDGTLMMSALEAGEVMTVKNSLCYFKGDNKAVSLTIRRSFEA